MGPITRWLKRLPLDLIDFVYPPFCPLCNAPPTSGPLCPTCESELVTLPSAVCSDCRMFVTRQGSCPLGHEALVVRPLGLFDSHYRTLLHTLKFQGDLQVGLWLGRRLGETLRGENAGQRFRAVAPVPLHTVRQRERGFNQSAVLAREVASVLDLPFVEPLKRLRNTPSQTRLDRTARQENVARAFWVRPGNEVSPLLLVDDVLTTGATLEACASALRAAGVTEILAVAVALAEAPAARAAAA